MGVQERSPLPEREGASHVALLPGGPQARQKHYKGMADSGLQANLGLRVL